MVRIARRTLATVTGVLVAVTSPAALARPVAAAPLGTPAEGAATAATGTSRVTLITGDVVDLAPAGGGRYAASVRPGPGRERITFHTVEADGGLRLLPSDAAPYVSAGVIDPDLFDIEELVADGYADASTGSLPLIVRYAGGRAPAVSAFSSARSVHPLPSVGGAAVAADKGSLGELWRSVTATPAAARTPTAALGGGLAGIWLDGRVRASLDRSVPQIGAPAAWQAGYDGSGVDVAVLDTGVDAAHPDLAGKVVEQRNFSDATDATDHFGHGTHVAATIAGTGAASGGSRKGVAPGADLLAGKVLNDAGVGYDSWIIAGMEWAVAQGAEVVNLSLGGDATDGTDPLSEAVNRLTAEHGTLFVVAAGNTGQSLDVGTPAAATAALAVGAVDRDESLAYFSSRGPRLGDEAVKPEITAPGVGIVAARAAGTGLDTPVDDNYTAASGTSMATPHVAGAAALLAQARPGWQAAQLKDALVSTARGNPAIAVDAQGGGRVDVARAVSQGVYGTATANLGVHREPATGTREQKLLYTNATAAPVTLDLAVDVAGSTAFTLSAKQVTVQPGQSATVPLTLDAAKLSRGRHTGQVTATGPGGVLVRTVVGATLEPPIHKVTFRAVDRRGEKASVPVILLFGDEQRKDRSGYIMPWDEGKAVEVYEGTYVMNALVEDGGPLDEQATFITNPELRVTGDLEILLDARTGTPIRIETPKPAEQQSVISYYERRVHANGRSTAHGVMHFSTVQQVNVTPTRRPSAGQYEFSSRWQLVAPMVRIKVPGVAGPLDVNLLHRSPVYDGTRRYRLVLFDKALSDKGSVRGAAALIVGAEDRSEQEQIGAAAEAGAAVAIIVRTPDMPAWTVWRPTGDREPIPSLVVANDDGQRLLKAAAGRPTIDLTLQASSPYLYDVIHVERGRVPERIVHRVTRDNTVRITSEYGENGGFGWAKEQRFGWRPWQEYAWNDTQRFVQTPKVREEWVSAGDSVWQHRVHYYYTWDDMNPIGGGMTEVPRSYAARSTRTEGWFTPVVRPAAVPGMVSARTADTLALWVPEFVDATRGHFQVADGDPVTAKLWRDGKLLADLPDARRDVATSAERAGYRLELTTERSGEEWQWATRTETAWEFRSGRPAAGRTEPLPLLQIGYAVPADLSGYVSGRHPHLIGLTLWHQEGLREPRGTTLRAEVSLDEGATWLRVPVIRNGDGYRALVPAGTGSVSLRVHASDAAGNTVTQTVIRAYGLH
ncbi:S8 family serine peptidase [Phytohabitans sp. ZYX-F-186]|uniref:S8 family serine peptidase n=1 Tax=Phytohabitans maris TaxID=3071409 RepID=A0ABU0ZL38_9ACTN|nr:S8 family serine peptidase [Phytohabitans sp. ZYX-F-186]MDQ7907112.1 S8 family serine peptidase [Phytohabitans sp. ZYX-F-186]